MKPFPKQVSNPESVGDDGQRRIGAELEGKKLESTA